MGSWFIVPWFQSHFSPHSLPLLPEGHVNWVQRSSLVKCVKDIRDISPNGRQNLSHLMLSALAVLIYLNSNQISFFSTRWQFIFPGIEKPPPKSGVSTNQPVWLLMLTNAAVFVQRKTAICVWDIERDEGNEKQMNERRRPRDAWPHGGVVLTAKRGAKHEKCLRCFKTPHGVTLIKTMNK